MKKISNQNYRYYYNNLSIIEKELYELLYLGFIKQKRRILLANASRNEIQKIYNFIMIDNPEIYYVEKITCEINWIGSVKAVCVEYDYSINKVANMTDLIEQECACFVCQHLYDKDYKKAIAVHDFIVGKCVYGNKHEVHTHSIIGVFRYKEAVCEGIAKAYKFLSDKLGLSCVVVYGNAVVDGVREPHAWNMIQVDGKMIHIDVTYDLMNSTNELIRYDYFGLNKNDLNSREVDYGISCSYIEFSYYMFNGLYAKSKSHLVNMVKSNTNVNKWMTFQMPAYDDSNIHNKILEIIHDSVAAKYNQSYKLEMKYNSDKGVYSYIFREQKQID